jgi:cation-transporting ATPase E
MNESTSIPQGLTEQEARARRERGQGNNIDLTPSRSYRQILWQNVFRFVNIVLFTIGALLVILGSPADAITTAGLILLNVIIGVVQEMRAKRKLDQIALLARPKVTVLRDGRPREADPSEIVLGDVLAVNPGDQIICDGEIVGDGQIEVDESLLTGESDYIPKKQGDPVFSGSFCITGSAYYTASKVGADSLANKITAKARSFKVVLTPLQNDVNFIIRLVGLVCVMVGVLLFLDAVRQDLPAVERVQIMAVVMGTIPQGLIFLVTLTYALGAVRLAGKGALIQQTNAVESMSNITVLCMDKTGTLTTNQIRLHALYPYHIQEAELRHLLGNFTASAGSQNRTSDAIRLVCEGQKLAVLEEVPFASSRKWSGLAFSVDGMQGSYVLGAPEILRPNLQSNDSALFEQVESWSGQGLRVVMFARSSESLRQGEQVRLPANLIPLGLVCLSDELRPDTQATLEAFTQAGIALKIISGDNPRTVAALAAQAGFDSSGGAVSGVDLANMNQDEFDQVARTAAVFGRITPDQKERLVESLKRQGQYVAMIGDGVNDVLSLKMADIGIAMQSGSAATRNVADIVLMNDSFAVLPSVFTEGQRIVNGILDTMRLLLTRTLHVTLLIIAVAILGLGFPYLPTQDTLTSFVTAGLPPIFLAAWAVSGQPSQDRLTRVARFVFPAGLTIAAVGLVIFLYFIDQGNSLNTARTATTIGVILCGLTLILFVKPLTPLLAITDPLTRDWRPTGVVVGSVIYFALIMAIQPLRDFFALETLSTKDFALILGIVVIWTVVTRYIYQRHLFERFFRLDYMNPK